MSIDLIVQNNDNLLPREKVRVERVKAAPYPDGRRVHVEIAVTPFRERPNLEITIVNAGGKPVSSTSAVAIMNFQVAFTLHLRDVTDPAGKYTVRIQLYYEDIRAPQDTHETALHIPPAAPDRENDLR
jgi:hypothetical protein